MANRNFNRAQNLEKEVKSLFADIAIGASGAPTLSKGLGIASVARVSAGLYDITLQDKYIRLMQCSVSQMVAAAQDINPQLVSEDVDGTKVIRVRFIDSSEAETDPDSGSRILVRIDLKNSSAGNS